MEQRKVFKGSNQINFDQNNSSYSSICAAISKDDTDESTNHLQRGKNKIPFNGFSEEYLDRLENGNLPGDNKSYTKRE
jgi:hypothetical protein